MSEANLALITWLIPAGPLAAFFIIVLLTNRNKTLSWLISWVGILSSLVFGWTVAFNMFGRDSHELASHPTAISSALNWLPFGDLASGNWLKMGIAVDPITAIMLFMVPLATTAILVYSVGYHRWGSGAGKHPILGVPNHDGVEPLLSRFFAFMSLFGGSMMLLVVADNLLMLFVGWELMGLCSYLLIGFWYARTYDDPKATPPRAAAVKAFLTTRIGDVIMLLGIVFFYRAFGTLNFAEAFEAASLLQVGAASAALISLLLFAGTVGKSAQFPLHVWLPDAMEGPTPVSAIIHAAAMVSAGIYLLVRIFPLIAVGMTANSTVGLIIAGVGAFTALMAATIALAQYDVKRVLAYSTISQLGFMVAAIGIGAYVAAAFHLITHAFFKALLFLGSGSIIHGMEHGAEHVHDHHTDPQDMRFMGGLRKKMPITFWTFLIGGLALSGFPFVTAGFWSKDEIFADAWHQATGGNTLALVVFIMLALAALLTAFYTMRQISLTFLGKPRTALAEHASESNGFMTIPLMVLSVFAIAVGWAGIPENLPVIGKLLNNNFFHHFVGATVEKSFELLNHAGIHVHSIEALPFSSIPLLVSLVVALGGLFLGWWTYGRKPIEKWVADPVSKLLGRPLFSFLEDKWRWDELYSKLFIEPVKYLSEKVVYLFMDRRIIDGTLHFVARSTFAIGHAMNMFETVVIKGWVDGAKDFFLAGVREFRSIQTGKIQEYALVSVLIAWALIAVVLLINSGLLSNLLS